VRFDVYCLANYFSGHTILSFTHIEGITLSVGEMVDFLEEELAWVWIG
jgi:hypothetical protein